MEEQEIQNLIDSAVKKATTPLLAAIGTLELRMNSHKHNQSDLTQELDAAGSSVTIYSGVVNSDGSANNLPDGWSSSKTGTGQYTVTHNLGTANYSAITTAYALAGFGAHNAVNSNDVQFKFLTASGGGTLSDTAFYFILLLF